MDDAGLNAYREKLRMVKQRLVDVEFGWMMDRLLKSMSPIEQAMFRVLHEELANND